MHIRSLNIICFAITLCCFKCSTASHLKQGYDFNQVTKDHEKVDCILSDALFYQTPDYTILRCSQTPNLFYFIPANLIVERDINNSPLLFSQYTRSNKMNVIVKFNYNKEKFIEAAKYLKSLDALYTLFVLQLNSVVISNLTNIPDRKINYSGTTTYAFFEGYIIFEIKGKRQINDMRALLLSANGFQMLYKFKYLVSINKRLIQKGLEIPIYINNINF